MNFLDNFSIDNFLGSLQYMWEGMLCIFIVIALIIISIVIMNAITNRATSKIKKDKKQ